MSFLPLPDDDAEDLLREIIEPTPTPTPLRKPAELTLQELLAQQRDAILSEFNLEGEEDGHRIRQTRIATRNTLLEEVPDAIQRIIALSRSAKEAVSMQACKYIIQTALSPTSDAPSGLDSLIEKLTKEQLTDV